MKMCVDKYLRTKTAKRKAAALALETGKKWPNGSTIKCYFKSGTPTQRKKVEEQAHKWEEYANIKFLFCKDSKSDIRIDFIPNGSYSYIGTDAKFVPKKEETINFGWLEDDSPDDEYERVVLHEFGHTLGAIHEHQSPANNIPWDKEAVYKYYTGYPNFWTKEDVDVNLFEKYNKDLTQFSEFDPKSIMIYAISNNLTLGDYEIKWTDTLSDTDKKWIAECYPKEIEVSEESPLLLIPDGQSLTGHLARDTMNEFKLKLDLNQSGIYDLSVYPPNTWISLSFNNKKLKYTKGVLRHNFGPGEYSVKIRNTLSEGVFSLACTKV